jgi:hypothetical protein
VATEQVDGLLNSPQNNDSITRAANLAIKLARKHSLLKSVVKVLVPTFPNSRTFSL